MDDAVIKSVRRVFEILELFDTERRPLTVKDVSARLDYPVVSTHALLKSIYLMGYADFDHAIRAYSPSRSLPAILEWIPDFLAHEQHIVAFAKALNEQTQETVNISRRVGARTRVVEGFACKYPIGVSTQAGTMMPILHSMTGLAAIAGLAPDERAWIMENERKLAPKMVLDKKTIDDVLQEFAERQTAMRCDLFVQGIGALCVPIKSHSSKQALVVGIAGPSERVAEHSEEYRDAVLELAPKFKVEIAPVLL